MKFTTFCRSFFVSVPRLAPAACFERVRAGEVVLIDVREASEWERGVAERAVLLALSDLTGRRRQWAPFLATVGQREMLLYCGVGVRANMAGRVLAAEGYRVANGGGLAEWTAAGWPVVPPGGAAASAHEGA